MIFISTFQHRLFRFKLAHSFNVCNRSARFELLSKYKRLKGPDMCKAKPKLDTFDVNFNHYLIWRKHKSATNMDLRQVIATCFYLHIIQPIKEETIPTYDRL